MSVTLDEWKNYTAQLSDDDAQAGNDWLFGEELPRRRDAAAAQEAVAQRENEIAEEYIKANPPAKGKGGRDKWVQPHGAFDAWPASKVVEYNGATYRNTLPIPNDHRPDAANSGWVREDAPTRDSGHKAWAVNLSVKTGEKYAHDGHLWRAKLDHTTHAGWIPSAATYAVWQDLGPLA